MKFSTIKKNVFEYGWLILLIAVFLFGFLFILWMGNSEITSGISPAAKIDPIKISYTPEELSPEYEISSNVISNIININKSPEEIPNNLDDLVNTPEMLDDELDDENDDERCPTLLIKRGNKIMLFNKNMPETPGENPIFFNNLDQYIKYAKIQKDVYKQNCPVLFLQEEVNAQGENVYRLRKTEGTTTNVDPLMMGSLTDYFKNQTNVMPKFAPPVGPQAFNQVQPNMQLPLSNVGVNNTMMQSLEQTQQPQMVQYEDASRDNKPYNQGFFAFDPTNQYVGRYTVIDQIHDSTKTQNQNGLSDNPMDQNWGGAVFTNKQVMSGKYKGDEVQPPTVNTALTLGDYPKTIEDNDIPTPKRMSDNNDQESMEEKIKERKSMEELSN
jgi:hypothetical protein